MSKLLRVGRCLGITETTMKVHRCQVTRSLADLARIAGKLSESGLAQDNNQLA